MRPTGLAILILVVSGAMLGCDPTIAPGKADPGTVGAPCGDATSCTEVSDPTCLKIGADGYCTTSCATLGQFACPSGAICEALGDQASYCLDGCCSNDDCRDGFRCASRPNLAVYVDLGVCPEPGVCLARCTSDASCEVGYRCDSTGSCVPKKGLDRGVGATCSKGDDCNSGTCLATFPGGYCTSPCGTQFQGCEPGSECYAFGDGGSSCLVLCQRNEECRAGYRCEAVASGESGVRGYCLPRCETSGCQEGFSCDAATGACVEGAASPGPLGAFCDNGSECLSGTCDTTQPNGYCTAACDGSCRCVGDKCRSQCSSEGDCRFGYICVEGSCLPACRADSDCSGEQVCDTGSGRCRNKAVGVTVQDFLNQSLNVTDQGSNLVSFTVPEDAISAVVYANDGRSELIALWQVFAPGDTLVFDITDPVSSRFGILPSASNFSALIPPGPVFNFTPGTYKVSLVRESGSASTALRVFGKVAAGFPERQTLDVVFTFAGAPEGVNAASAQNDSAFQRGVQVMRTLYGQLGIDLGQVTYEDMSASDAAALRTIDTVDGPNNELGQLFAKSKSSGQGINFFFVQEILGGDAGFIILGIAGGIPGPPAIMGTPRSGVAVTMMGFREDPDVFGNTMAHEGGHYLGLFHTTEAGGNAHDPLPDTAQCPASNDRNFDGYVTAEECAGKGADNFMFWLAGPSANKVSAEQGRVLRRNPATR